MISRQWRGLARTDRADDYVRHLQDDTFPALRRIPGFVDASILRRTTPEGVEFLIVTRWESMAAVRAFAGEPTDTAVVPDAVQAMLVDYDRVVRHFDVVV